MTDYKEVVQAFVKMQIDPTMSTRLKLSFKEERDDEKKQLVFIMNVDVEEFVYEKQSFVSKDGYIVKEMRCYPEQEGFDFEHFYKETEKRAYFSFLKKINESACLGIISQREKWERLEE